MEQQNRKKKSKLKVILLVVLVLASIFAIFIKNMSGPAEGTVAYTNPNQPATKPTTVAPNTYNGQAISFTYPGTFNLNPPKKAAGMLDHAILVSNNHQGKQVAIAVTQEPISQDSGMNYRKLHPDLYKQSRDAFGNIVFTKSQGGSEYTGFIVHGSLVASVSLSSTFNRDLADDYNSIVKNLQWKQ